MSKIRCLMLGILCFLMVGCGAAVLVGTGAAAGVAGFKYYEGALIVDFKAPFKDTWDASLRALKGMEGLEVKSADHGITEGKIWGTFSDKKPLQVSFKYVSANETQVKIRVGVLGDQDASIIVKDRIKKELFDG
ncbi:MAG: DUF3568 family protein [Pseudomonadota bacterium]